VEHIISRGSYTPVDQLEWGFIPAHSWGITCNTAHAEHSPYGVIVTVER
jgi:hypothetical protein